MFDSRLWSRALLGALLTLSLASCGSDAAEGGDPGEDVTDPSDGSTDVGGADTDAGDPDVADPDVVDADVVEPDADVVDPEVTDPDADVVDPEVVDPDADAVDPDVVDPDADAVDPDADAVDPDVVIPENCGDGVLDPDEECDDGNEDDLDECTSACTIAACGDGFVGLQPGAVEEIAVIVTNPFGVEGPVCDVGASCAGGACDVADDGTAPEHGICQALGYERAVSVVWGGSEGADADPAPRAGNWGCFDYACTEGPRPDSDGACGEGRMLVSISCAGFIPEACDEGTNGDNPNQCREGCELPVCGDGVADTEFGEDCDDGNDVADDGCNNCLFPSCGDGVVQTGEDCDDGNDDDADECRSDCTFPVCGDGIVQPGEECDDGGDNSELADACRLTCELAGCGDFILDTGEECDDGNTVNDDGCSNSCLTPQCGDGITQIDAGEECDDGNDNELDFCNSACVAAVCGDGIVQTEIADLNLSFDFEDGEMPAEFTITGDAQWFVTEDAFEGAFAIQSGDINDSQGSSFSISTNSQFDSDVTFNWRTDSETCCDELNVYIDDVFEAEFVGSLEWTDGTFVLPAGEHTVRFGYEKDGSVSGGDDAAWVDNLTIRTVGGIGETCDDGDANGDEADLCRTNCQLPVCGDGITDAGEECDDANDDDVDACSNACTLPVCGDGIQQADEECDDGDANSDTEADACRTTCEVAFCLDGVLDEGEECDDGNDDNDDGCSLICRTPGCGDGAIQAGDGEECDDGNDVDDDFCTNACFLPVCGDGIRQGDEDCDDGNDNDGDLCSNSCVVAICGDGVVQEEALIYNEAYDFEDGTVPVTILPFGTAPAVILEDDGAAGNEVFEGTFGLVTADINDGETSGFSFELDGLSAVTIEFMFFLESESCCDEVNIRNQDGALLQEWDDQGAWTMASTEVPAGVTFITVAFEKDGSVSTGADRARFDNLSVTSTSPGAEACDDGDANANDADACRTNCQLPFCGDGITDSGEECDDGNDEELDACNNACVLPICGDGVQQGDEECDDGDDVDDNECTNACALPVCGDGIFQPSNDEFCDDGNDIEDDGCRSTCQLATCGDGVTDDGEECDDGNLINDDACDNGCFLPVCGDGVRAGDEICDDGNTEETDACLNDCTLPSCGDGIVNISERQETFVSPLVTNPQGVTGPVCDDGQSCTGTGCDYSDAPNAPEHGICQALGFDRTLTIDWGNGAGDDSPDMPHVYNWICENFVCRQGDNDFSTDNCSAGEMLNTITCFSGGVELCDDGDGNADEPDACRTNCLLPACGDGILDTGEACDDGNLADGDACTSTCELPVCGNGVAEEGEECDDGDFDDLDYCTGACVLNVCGDGIIQNDPVDTDESYDVEDGAFPAAFTNGESPWVVVDMPGNGSDFALESGDGEIATFSYSFELLDEAVFSFDYRLTSAGFLAPLVVTIDGDQVLSDNFGTWALFSTTLDPGEHEVVFSYEARSGFDRARVDNVSLRTVTRIDEACDDGDANDDTPDACRLDCTLPVCGDGIADSAEECDDGNGSDLDGCRSDCTLPVCGDGFAQEGEECDDGNFDELDYCNSACELNVCGDGVVQTDPVDEDVLFDFEEEIPDALRLEGWGRGPGNGSDGGLASALGAGVASILTYEFTTIGNADVSVDYQIVGGGFLGDIEVYIDGNLVINDSFGTWATTGGTVGPGEHTLVIAFVPTETADGAQIDNIRVSSLPRIAEQCDDGNDDDTDECSNSCEAQICGDGIQSGSEPCDDGNEINDDACSNECVVAICGDGAIQSESRLPATVFDFEEGFPEAFTNNELAPWFVSDDANSGARAIQSGDIGDGQISDFTFETNQDVAAEVTFAFRIDSESCCDDLTIRVDGAQVLRLVGEPVWTTASFALSPGPHTIQFSYEKDGSLSTGADAAWVDDIVIAPEGVFREQCDDGNNVDGDGCSAMCSEEI